MLDFYFYFLFIFCVCWNLYTVLKTDFKLFVKMFFFIIHPIGIHSNLYFIIFNFINLIIFFLLVKLARDLSVSFSFLKNQVFSCSSLCIIFLSLFYWFTCGSLLFFIFYWFSVWIVLVFLKPWKLSVDNLRYLFIWKIIIVYMSIYVGMN